ncbi:MAG: hypothetical protein LBD72_01750 [Puniceicoccales bacterium]|nr:hypothetical protein [Puniceicoccales bacterium]
MRVVNDTKLSPEREILFVRIVVDRGGGRSVSAGETSVLWAVRWCGGVDRGTNTEWENLFRNLG